MRPLQLGGVLAFVLACGLANPLAKRTDGAVATSRLRVGLASVRLVGGDYVTHGTVQLSMAHTAAGPRRIEISAVRLIVRGTDVGAVPIDDVTHWHHGAYRTWNRIVWPYRTAKLSIDIGAIEWEELLESHGLAHDGGDIHVEVDLAIDGEPVVVRSMFAVRREAEDRVFIMT